MAARDARAGCRGTRERHRSVRGDQRTLRRRVVAPTARPTPVHGRQDVPARAADEAGSDEHGGIDRKPRTVSGPPARDVGSEPAGTYEAARSDDEMGTSRSDARLAPRADP